MNNPTIGAGHHRGRQEVRQPPARDRRLEVAAREDPAEDAGQGAADRDADLDGRQELVHVVLERRSRAGRRASLPRSGRRSGSGGRRSQRSRRPRRSRSRGGASRWRRPSEGARTWPLSRRFYQRRAGRTRSGTVLALSTGRNLWQRDESRRAAGSRSRRRSAAREEEQLCPTGRVRRHRDRHRARGYVAAIRAAQMGLQPPSSSVTRGPRRHLPSARLHPDQGPPPHRRSVRRLQARARSSGSWPRRSASTSPP